MDTGSVLGRSSLSAIRETVCRPFRNGRQCSTANILQQTVPPEGVEGRCLLVSMDGTSGVRLPTMESCAQSPGNPPTGGGNHDISGTVLADAAVVPGALGASDRQTVSVPCIENSPHSEKGAALVPRQGQPASFCLENIRRNFQAEGVSPQVAELAAASRRNATIRTYDSRLARFRSWAGENSCHPMDASVDQVAAFLVLLYEEGKQVSTVKNYRSAIASIHKGFDDNTYGGNKQRYPPPAAGHV